MPTLAEQPLLATSEARPRIESSDDYVASLRGRNLKVYLFGELVEEPVDHPMIRPSINAVAETYDLAVREPELATALSPLTGERVNRFLHIAESPQDLVLQNKMQRKMGQATGTCFQRCVGMDALNALYSVLAGGLMVTMPSQKELENPATGELLRKYLKGRTDVPTEDRMKILRLIENMTLGRNAVGYLTESMHGAGSPQAQRIQIARQMQLGYKKSLAKKLADIEDDAPETAEASGYFDRVFDA